MPHIGVPELIIICVIIFFLFGAKRLPDIMKSIGRSIKEFKKGTKEGDDSDKKSDS